MDLMRVMGVDVVRLADSITRIVTEQMYRHLDVGTLNETLAGIRRELAEMRKVLVKIEKNTRA